MTPLRFTRGHRELFALHMPAHPALSLARGVVLCNPFGQEAIRAHRFYRALGLRLAEAGLDVLRFDYYGSGDSGGNDGEFDLDGAVLDTIAAAGLLRRHSGAQDISFIGLRLGASIAWLASRQLPAGSTRLVLIEPVTDGVAYLESLRAAHARTLRQIFGSRWSLDASLRELHLPSNASEALGFIIGDGLRRQISERLQATAPWTGASARGLLLVQDPDRYASWPAQWGAGSLHVEASASDIDWTTNSALNTSLVPTAWVDRMRGFMLDGYGHA